MAAFGTDGFHATSLDALASTLGVTKQTVLHHFGSKDGVLAATTEAAATLLSDAVETALLKPGNPDERLVLGFVRDLSRLGSTPLANLRVALAPFLTRASAFVEEEMFDGNANDLTRSSSALEVVLAAYAAVLAAAAEVEVLRSLGVEPTGRLFLRRRREVIEYLRSLALERTLAFRSTALNKFTSEPQ
jgi:AcrR family transcriptional regulator